MDYGYRTLFYEEHLPAQLRERQQRASQVVDNIPQEQFLVSTDEQLVAYVEGQVRVEYIVLHEEARSMRQEECRIEASNQEALYHLVSWGEHLTVPGTRVIITTPFTGDAWIFNYRPSTSWSVLPRGRVEEARGGQPAQLILVIEQSHDTSPEQFKQRFGGEIDLIHKYLGSAKVDVEAFNSMLPGRINTAIQARRTRLERHKGIAALLDIPLQTKPGAPSLEPIRVEPRSLPRLPVPPKTGLKPEPGIILETYEKILNIIRHEARTYETTPRTYAKFDEEELRDVILAHLNGHFEGKAAGEVFRRNGKTDICIQEENRAAFVAECKVWQGAGQVASAVDQLLSYLTWRDSKAAFVMFNKSVKDFSSILKNLPKAISEHRCFIHWQETTEAGEWRAFMRSIEDEGRTVIVHVFAINIFDETKRASSKVRAT